MHCRCPTPRLGPKGKQNVTPHQSQSAPWVAAQVSATRGEIQWCAEPQTCLTCNRFWQWVGQLGGLRSCEWPVDVVWFCGIVLRRTRDSWFNHPLHNVTECEWLRLLLGILWPRRRGHRHVQFPPARGKSTEKSANNLHTERDPRWRVPTFLRHDSARERQGWIRTHVLEAERRPF